MKLATEKRIIEKAVAKAAAAHVENDREEIARLAARLADKKGVNVLAAPYLQEIFYEALDNHC